MACIVLICSKASLRSLDECRRGVTALISMLIWGGLRVAHGEHVNVPAGLLLLLSREKLLQTLCRKSRK